MSEDFVSDLKACVAEVKEKQALAKQTDSGEKKKPGNMVMLYGPCIHSAIFTYG